MKYLLYCIFKAQGPAGPGPKIPPGVGGRPVTVVTDDHLSAAVSWIDAEDLSADLPQALAYEKVVQAFHQRQTVIPMRFGAVFADESQVLRLLADRRREYEVLLEELEGCVEMGIRILLPGEGVEAGLPPAEAVEQVSRVAPGLEGEGPGDNPGRAYLTAKREHYAAADGKTQEQTLVADAVCRALAGLFVRHCRESRLVADHLLVSLYFLVPQGAVERFCHLFQQITAQEAAKLLLSGPWPPYNFVLSSPQEQI